MYIHVYMYKYIDKMYQYLIIDNKANKYIHMMYQYLIIEIFNTGKPLTSLQGLSHPLKPVKLYICKIFLAKIFFPFPFLS